MGDARQIAAQFLEAFNDHDEDGIRRLCSPDVVLEAPGDVRLAGPEQVTGFAMVWLNAFPDAKEIVHNEVVGDDTVVQEYTFEGTHTATLAAPDGEIPATNRRVTGRGVQIVRIRDGAIAEFRLYWDQVQVLTQLGLMPEPAATQA
jgi:steroid delta-isomerase-like uncharacterized protein